MIYRCNNYRQAADGISLDQAGFYPDQETFHQSQTLLKAGRPDHEGLAAGFNSQTNPNARALRLSHARFKGSGKP